MHSRLTLTLICSLVLSSLPLTLSSQGIGYRNVNYSPYSETIDNVKVPITPAIISFTNKIKSDLKAELKAISKKDAEYELKRKNVIEANTLKVVNSLMEIVEIEALKTFRKEHAMYSVYNFLHCWAGKNFRSTKKNFCKGCWNEHLEKERFYANFATIED